MVFVEVCGVTYVEVLNIYLESYQEFMQYKK